MNTDVLDTLRSRLDILDLAREYLRDLKHSGKSWSALCPFHEEKTPSFHINPERGLFYCFGCATGGDAIRFYMNVERLSFKEAIDALCERYGIPKPQGFGAAASGKQEKIRKDVLKALDLARSFFANAFWVREDPIAEQARDYVLRKRLLTPETLKRYGIGLAPRSASALLTYLVSKQGIEPRVLEQAGLVTTSMRDGKYCDFFRGRVVFPVLDLNDHPIAFGGRVLESQAPASGPKYLNSPDTDLFKKGGTLYGLAQHKGRIREKDKCYVVEGYFDVVTLAQLGVDLAVSPMGGALSVAHARLIKRFASSVMLIFDPDAAGISSSIRVARTLISQDIRVRTLRLPEGMDPDEFILKYGKETFEAFELKESKDFIDFELESKLGTNKSSGLDLTSRIRIAESMIPSLQVIGSEIERRESLLRVAQALQLDPIGLEREFYKTQAAPKYNNPAATAVPAKPPVSWNLSPEETLLALALEDINSVRQELKQSELSAEDFEHPKIWNFIFHEANDEAAVEDTSWQDLISRVTLMRDNLQIKFDIKKEMSYVITFLKNGKLHKELKALKAIIEAHHAKSTPCEAAVLMRYHELQRVLKNKAR